jgi:toxin ParE1/3/4
MSRKIIVHEEARYDVMESAYTIAQDSLEAADRFAEAVDTAYKRLADMPGIGTTREYNNPKLRGMRMSPVPGFMKHLIFYRATDAELRVFRVIHGSRDIESIFKPDNEDD